MRKKIRYYYRQTCRRRTRFWIGGSPCRAYSIISASIVFSDGRSIDLGVMPGFSIEQTDLGYDLSSMPIDIEAFGLANLPPIEIQIEAPPFLLDRPAGDPTQN